MLSDHNIKIHKEAGNIYISPYEENALQSNSYDVRIGDWIVRQVKDFYPRLEGPLIFGTSDVTKLWGKPEQVNGIIVLNPGELILAHTMEYIGGLNCVTSEMKARSTSGRWGITVCKCAGLGDVGYVSRWTMEVKNETNHQIGIRVGTSIAQIAFHEVGEVDEDYKNRGNYGQTTWTPEDMLPKVKQ